VALSTLDMAFFRPSCASETASFKPRRPRRVSERRKLGPERLRLGGAHLHPQHLAPAVGVDRDSTYHGTRHDPPGLARLHVRGVDPQVGPPAPGAPGTL
jgi:hypothetical protein